jgi:primary-amine oxidase
VRASHPLEPLAAAEIEQAFALLKGDSRVPAGAFFPTLELQEPPKSEVLEWKPGRPFARRVYAEIYDRPGNRAFEAVVDLRARKVLSWTPRPGVQPATYADEYEVVPKVVREDARWQAAMRKRGITNLDDVHLEVWTGGDLPVAGAPRGTRLLRVLSFFRGDLPNMYDRPIEGVVVAVDANRVKVVEVTDTAVAPIVRDETGNPKRGPRPALKPLRTVQPDGPDFEIQGGEVRWQNWRFRPVLHQREGLVLHAVGYEDQGRVRPILYRAGMSEISVPYGLPDRNWVWRSAFDLGEYGFGRYALKLEPGVDVPENTTLIDTVVADDKGGVVELPGAIGVYERHSGILWKRVNPNTAEVDARAARDLVVTSNSWIGNYIYGVNWIFHQDGSMDVEIALTGTLLLRGVISRKQGADYGTPVANYLAAPFHQHFFSFRLDFDVDGATNVAKEMDVLSDGRGANGVRVRETMLRSERRAIRDLDASKARMWKVMNPAVPRTPGDDPPGYLLMPHANAVPYAAQNFGSRKRAAFANHHLWVTAFRDSEQYAAGAYPYQGKVGEGLPAWTADDESLDDQDLVLWYTLGVTHVPTREQHPVMSVERAGFRLMPASFFEANPALDLPPHSSAGK